MSSVLDYANLNQETAGYIEGYKAYEDQSIRRNNPIRGLPGRQFAAIPQPGEPAAGRGQHPDHHPYLRTNEMNSCSIRALAAGRGKQPGQPRPARRAEYGPPGQQLGQRPGGGVHRRTTQGVQEQDFSPNQPAGVTMTNQVEPPWQRHSAVAGTFQNWELSAGLRLEYSYYDYDNRTGDGSACAPTASACRFYRPADRDDDFTDWSANIGASYSLTADTLTYLRLANVFAPPRRRAVPPAGRAGRGRPGLRGTGQCRARAARHLAAGTGIRPVVLPYAQGQCDLPGCQPLQTSAAHKHATTAPN